MSIETLKNKYRSEWRDCSNLVELHDYFKAHAKEHSFSLVSSGGRPSIHIDPGLELEERERWEIIAVAEELLLKALPDLRRFIDQGDIVLPHK